MFSKVLEGRFFLNSSPVFLSAPREETNPIKRGFSIRSSCIISLFSSGIRRNQSQPKQIDDSRWRTFILATAFGQLDYNFSFACWLLWSSHQFKGWLSMFQMGLNFFYLSKIAHSWAKYVQLCYYRPLSDGVNLSSSFY